MNRTPRIVAIGEGMIELSPVPESSSWRLGYGGDSLNTAIHLARLGRHVAYLTALGADPFSEDLRKAWASEGVQTDLILTDPDRQAGLYAIRTDPAGERSFYYWREISAARHMFDLPEAEAALAVLGDAALIVFSLVSLAVLAPAARTRLLDACAAARARGARVAFDGNFRPQLWASVEEARATRDAALAVSDIGLPTLEDERCLEENPDLNAEAVATLWASHGVGEVVVKLGHEGCRLPDGRRSAPARRLEPVDTSGAGDAFNAGYLSARFSGLSAGIAARAGHDLAGWVIRRSGAVPARDALAPYP